MIAIYSVVLFSLSIYSFSLIDPNITFVQSKWWEVFREKMVYFGYYQRQNSWIVYLTLTSLLFAFQYFFVNSYKKFDPLKLAILIGSIMLISYPFLSHDFFNYMFDARILTHYHQSPYLFKALDFPGDQWLRFMHWTHRTYPYGPVFLVITVVPSFLSMGKFALSFLLFKLTFILCYFLAVFYLGKLNRKHAMIFATSPLIIIEGLINSHNDLIALSIGIIGVVFLLNSSPLKSGILFLLSGGIKFITVLIFFLRNQKADSNTVIFASLLALIFYLSVTSEIQPWYFLNLLIFLPYFEQSINRLNIFFFGLLISYYPYIRMGGWDSFEKVEIKHWIILFAAILNLIYILVPNKKIIFKQEEKDSY